MKEFYVEGKIEGKGRPRFVRGHAYTPKNTKKYEEIIQKCYIGQCGHDEPSDKPIKATIHAYFEPPKSISQKKRYAMYGTKVLKKPDADNIIKIVLDALNKLAYKDDRQVFAIEIDKIYAEDERLEIQLEEEE